MKVKHKKIMVGDREHRSVVSEGEIVSTTDRAG